MLLSNSDDYDDHWMLNLMVEDDEHLDRIWGGRFVSLLTFYWFVDRKIDLGDRKNKTSVGLIWAQFLDRTNWYFNSNHIVAWKEQKIFKKSQQSEKLFFTLSNSFKISICLNHAAFYIRMLFVHRSKFYFWEW